MPIQTATLSRPVRLAAVLQNISEDECTHLFLNKRILICLEPTLASSHNARMTLVFAVNQTLRFCPNLTLMVPPESRHLVGRCLELAHAIHGADHEIQILDSEGQAKFFDAIINIGTRVCNHLPWITVNSGGWVARVASSGSGQESLPWAPASPNALGALAAACLGAGGAFFTIAGQLPHGCLEISLLSHEQAAPGRLQEGPPLPSDPLAIEAFIVGCGAVANGWAYTIKRLPINGSLQAIDRQSLRIENLGPYVLATRASLKIPKAQIIADYLEPAISVTPRPEEWDLFKIRLKYGIAVPPLIVNGLDHVGTRHSVQRLWPETLVDLAAGGLTCQVIVKNAASDGLCLLNALDIPPGERDWAERLALETGLSPDRIRNESVTEITQKDIDAAGPAYCSELARSRGKLICGRITEQNLQMENDNPDFTPAVPFVTAFSGIVGAAETMKLVMGFSGDLHYQRHFQSNQARALQMTCHGDCECQKIRQLTTAASEINSS